MLAILVVGLGLLAGFYFLLNPPQSENRGVGELYGKTVTSTPANLTLALSSPDDNLLVFTPDLLIQGKTAPNATVILSREKEDLALHATSQGDFSTTVTLSAGANQFTLAVFDDSGDSKTESRTVYYSKEKI